MEIRFPVNHTDQGAAAKTVLVVVLRQKETNSQWPAEPKQKGTKWRAKMDLNFLFQVDWMTNGPFTRQKTS